MASVMVIRELLRFADEKFPTQICKCGDGDCGECATRELLAEVDRLREALAEQDDFILKFIPADRNGDWACAQCKPHSDMIEEGFMCGLHRAAARASFQPTT